MSLRILILTVNENPLTPPNDDETSSTRNAAQGAKRWRSLSEHDNSTSNLNVKTLSPLSPFTYYRRNVGRTLPIGGAIIISCFLIAAIVTLLNSVDRSITTNYGLVRAFSILTSQLEDDVSPRVLDLVKRDPELKTVIESTPTISNIRTVFGEMPVPFYGIDQDKMQDVIRYSGNKLVAGRLPKLNSPEIVMTRQWANNYGKKLNEWIVGKRENLRPPPIPEKQQIVGILDGGVNIALADRAFLLLEIPEPVQRTSYLMVSKTPSGMAAMNNRISRIIGEPQKFGISDSETRFVRLFTFDNLVGELRSHLEFLYQFLAIADALVIGAVALLSGFLANIYFEQRLGEFGLLSAFGFRRERLARRVVVETGILVVAGWLLGIGFTWLVFRGLDVFYMAPRGLVLASLDRLALIYTLPIPILVGVASLATVLTKLYRLDPIDIMERR